MNTLLFLLTPFFYFYVFIYSIREKLFGYDAIFNYLPAEILKIYMPVHMDIFWLKRGFFGRNKCMVPKGHPYSARFDSTSPYFQTWIGNYYLTRFTKEKFKSELDKVMYLGGASIEDQNVWLLSYGIMHPDSKIINKSIVKVSERKLGNFTQKVYYGEMESFIDDSKSNNYDFKIVHLSSSRIAAIYNGKEVNPRFLQKDRKPTLNEKAILFGYFSVIQISKGKYILSYACGTKENKDKISGELLSIMNNISVATT